MNKFKHKWFGQYWIQCFLLSNTTILVTIDKFDLNRIFINVNKLKLYQYLEFVSHSFPTFVPNVLLNIIQADNLQNNYNYEFIHDTLSTIINSTTIKFDLPLFQRIVITHTFHDDCALNLFVILSSFHIVHDYHFPKNDLYHYLMVKSCIPSYLIYKHQLSQPHLEGV